MLPDNSLLQDRYRIVEQIGRGGMGAVYRAVDTRLRATVALKQTMVEGEPLRKAFEREAQLLASLRHQTLPHVSDHFVDERGQFLVMEYIPGEDFGRLLQQRSEPFSLEDVLRWADQLLDALDYLHTRTPPIIHRDIKPQNLKLTDRNEIVLLDFGLAKGTSVQTRVTSTGSIFGYTPHYAPLEQIHDMGTDPRSDLYALAATLFHLLTNQIPPDAVTRAAAKVNDQPDPLPAIRTINPAVNQAVDEVIQQALSQRASLRPASAVLMRTMLREAAGGTMPRRSTHSPAPTPSTAATTVLHTAETATTAQPAPSKRRWHPAVIGIPLVVLLVGATFFATRALSSQPTGVPTIIAEPVALLATEVVTPGRTIDPTSDAVVVAGTAYAGQTAAAQVFTQAIQTTLALTPATSEPTVAPSATPEPTVAPTAAPEPAVVPTTAPPPTNPPNPSPVVTQPAKPTSLPPTQPPPTATPAPPAPPQSTAKIITTGSGTWFRATADIATNSGDGDGSCIAGKVLSANGNPFPAFGLQIDNRGTPREPTKNNQTGTYRLCGLSAGEWGIAIYAAGGVDVPGQEQRAHQVRVQLSGTPGEILYVNFRATAEFPEVAPSATPISSPYDGNWFGSVSGKTENGTKDYKGNFRMEVRNGAVYSISTDGASCIFDHYPGFPKGALIDGNSFAVGGQVFNPQDGSKADIDVNVSGVFSSGSRASGSIGASQNGSSCITGSWAASK